jgi:hypothetical protein
LGGIDIAFRSRVPRVRTLRKMAVSPMLVKAQLAPGLPLIFGHKARKAMGAPDDCVDNDADLCGGQTAPPTAACCPPTAYAIGQER